MTVFSSEERQLLDDSLQAYFSGNYGLGRWKQLRAMPGTGRREKEWQDYADLGWLGVALPEYAGGTDGGATELGILMAAAGRHIALEPLLGTIVLGARAIEVAGSESQRGALLPDIARGNLQLAFCHAEPEAGYARDFVRAVAKPDGKGYRIDGVKSFALGAHAADMLIVSTRLMSPDGPVGLFLVRHDSRGLTFNVARSFDGRLGATSRLENVHVDADSLLGEGETDLLPLIDDLIDRGAIAVCAEACGAMAAATQMTIDYLKVREQFGQPLSKFQVLQHRLVDMSLACEEARAMVHAALDALDDELPDAQRAVWQAKVVAAQSARYVGAQSLQLHGGIGMTDELAIGHFYKRLCVCEAQFGDGDWYLSRLASQTGPADLAAE
jgi:alkylation response protein AidB-like acyl-CoA dehydrogenase